MKQLLTGIAIALLFASCKNVSKPIVSVAFIDSLISHYSDTAIQQSIDTDIQFWKGRIDAANPGFVNELKYAAALVRRFRFAGDINDVITADSILYISDKAFNHKEPGPNMALVRNSILQHRFRDADSLLNVARVSDIKKYESAAAGFDVAFELGQYMLAETALKNMADPRDYGYNFRRAKLAHYSGEMDTAIAAMHRASVIAAGDIYLKQAALANEADLNLHNSNLQQANDLYMESIRLNATDLHCIMGLGWIALVHDNNDSLAEKIFRFVQTKTKAPDVILKMACVADKRGDSVMHKKYAAQFASIVSAPEYGNMYNKYLLELYSGILNDAAKAELIAAKELLNRTTPQTYAWYVWALFTNNKTTEAEKIYQQHVSGKPLEGLELYWMGKYMQAQNKGYNAKQFFKAAEKNRYDLSPAMMRDLEEELVE